MSEEPSGENANDAVASALSDLATAATGLDDWHQIRDWALKGAAENQIPPQLSGLDSSHWGQKTRDSDGCESGTRECSFCARPEEGSTS
jgi:hypothetical protein